MIKCYVQNGYNKKVFMATNYKQAAKTFLKSLVATKDNGDEIAELFPITLISDYGFIEDIQKSDNEEKFDDIHMFSTAELFKEMGRKDIANFVLGLEKKIKIENVEKNSFEEAKTFRRLLKMLRD